MLNYHKEFKKYLIRKFHINTDSRIYKVWSWIYNFVLSQWFYVLLAPLIAIAAEYPNFARHGGLIKAQYSITYLATAIIFFQNGLSMKTSVFIKHLIDWRVHLVSLVFQFLITGGIVFGIMTGILKSGNSQMDPWLLAGAIVTGTTPTTIASNVIMTRKAKGTEEQSISIVFVSNLFGAFISPLLVQMYLKNSNWAFANPSNGTTFQKVYRDVMKQLGFSVFIPLFIGQCVNNINPEKVLAINTKYKLAKVASFCLLMNLFSSFSTAFYQKAFTSVPGASIIMIFFFNIGIYLFFTVLTFFVVRNDLLLKFVSKYENDTKGSIGYHIYKFFRPFYLNRKDTVSMLFCAPAKSVALGIALVSSQYGDHSPYLGKILVALVLYSTEQVLFANFLVVPFRKWIKQENFNEKGKLEDSA